MSGSLSSFETKSLRFSKEVNSLESQLNDAKVTNKTHSRIGFYTRLVQHGCGRGPFTLGLLFSALQESLQDETRQKMTLATRVRALEEEKNGLMERLEEEEERSKELTRQIQTHSQQVIRGPPSSRTVGACVPLCSRLPLRS